MKIIVTIISTNLVTSLLSSRFCPFIETKNKNQIFSKLVVLKREVSLLFVYRESRSTSKVCRVQQIYRKRIFLLVLQFIYYYTYYTYNIIRIICLYYYRYYYVLYYFLLVLQFYVEIKSREKLNLHRFFNITALSCSKVIILLI